MEKYHKSDVCPIEKENERDENYKADNPQIDSSKTIRNYRLAIRFNTYTEFINDRIKSLNLSAKPRKDAVVMNSFVLGSDNEFFSSLHPWETRDFFTDCYEFFTKRYGEENIISAVVHQDETTPHMHLNLIPITTDGRLCSKELFNKQRLRDLQTDFYESVGKKYGLERGKEGSQAKHLSTAEFKAKKIIEQAEEIKQENQVYADALKEAENGEISKKKGKLKEQVVALLAENADLKKRLDKSMDETLKYANENRDLRKDNEKMKQGYRIAATLQKQNPKEFDRIVYGKPVGRLMDRFFDSVLSMFTPEVTSRSSRLEEIKEELEDEKKRQDKLNGYYNSK